MREVAAVEHGHRCGDVGHEASVAVPPFRVPYLEKGTDGTVPLRPLFK
jgi:hypothetical protein